MGLGGERNHRGLGFGEVLGCGMGKKGREARGWLEKGGRRSHLHGQRCSGSKKRREWLAWDRWSRRPVLGAGVGGVTVDVVAAAAATTRTAIGVVRGSSCFFFLSSSSSCLSPCARLGLGDG